MLQWSRRRRLAAALRELGAQLDPQQSLAGLEPELTKGLLNLTRRMRPLDDPARRTFRVCIASLANDPRLTGQLNASSDSELMPLLNEQSLVVARDLVKTRVDKIRDGLPDGCALDVDALAPLALGFLLDGVEPSAIVERLRKAVLRDPVALLVGYETWRAQAASLVLVMTRERLDPRTPHGLEISTALATPAIEAIVSLPFDLGGVQRKFEELVVHHPEDYIPGYHNWVVTRASEILESLRELVSAQLPTGCSLDGDACVERLVELIDTGMPMSQVPPRFLETFQENAFTLVRGLEERLRERAAAIFAECKKKIELPEGVSFRQQSCITLLLKLIKERLPAENLIARFVKDIEASPKQYLDVPVRRSTTSSSPTSESADRAMLASAPRHRRW